MRKKIFGDYSLVEYLYVLEHILPGVIARPINLAPDAFVLEPVDEAFRHRIVLAAGHTRKPPRGLKRSG